LNFDLPLISEPPTSESLRRRVLAILAARNGSGKGKAAK
jgi:hypothetical protein